MNRKILSAAMAVIISAASLAAASVPVSAEWVKDGKNYSYTDDSGEKLTYWQNIDGSRYYFGKDGKMRTGWRKISGKTYYFGKNGVMRTGKRRIDGKIYVFGEDGALKQNQVNLSAEQILDKIKSELGESYTCDNVCEENKITDFLGLDMKKIESYAYENNAISAINMDTAVILKVKDGYADTTTDLLQERFEQTGGYSLSYGYDPYRTEQARLFVNGNYVAFLILGEKPDYTESEDEQRKFAAAEGEKVDAAWEKIFGEKPVNLVKIPEPYDTNGMLA